MQGRQRSPAKLFFHKTAKSETHAFTLFQANDFTGVIPSLHRPDRNAKAGRNFCGGYAATFRRLQLFAKSSPAGVSRGKPPVSAIQFCPFRSLVFGRGLFRRPRDPLKSAALNPCLVLFCRCHRAF
jgi:hypothetical protein